MEISILETRPPAGPRAKVREVTLRRNADQRSFLFLGYLAYLCVPLRETLL